MREDAMYEEYYGFTEKPFSLTPDPKYLFKSASHANAFELLQYAARRREGFVVITGDIGTGKTTLCRAMLDQLDRKTFSALILNPFLSEEDLLRLILQDFGIVSRDEMRRGRLAGVSKQDLIDTLNAFLLSLQPIGASALLVIDEAQNLPLQVLEQIRILSNLETDKEKLLQIVLVGQSNLKGMLRSMELRQLDQRVSIKYELMPLSPEETGAYVMHRLAIGGGTVSFSPPALSRIYRCTGGIPRLINLVCDRALLAAYSARTKSCTAGAHRSCRGDAGDRRAPNGLPEVGAPAGGPVCRGSGLCGARRRRRCVRVAAPCDGATGRPHDGAGARGCACGNSRPGREPAEPTGRRGHQARTAGATASGSAVAKADSDERWSDAIVRGAGRVVPDGVRSRHARDRAAGPGLPGLGGAHAGIDQRLVASGHGRTVRRPWDSASE